jgi:hypothetical protein
VIWLLSLATAGTLEIVPDHVVLHAGQQDTVDFEIKNAGNGRISGIIAATKFGNGINCTTAELTITPESFVLLPGYEQPVHVRYSGDVGCVAAVGLTVGATVIVVPILVTDDFSKPIIVRAGRLPGERMALHAVASGVAPIPIRLAVVQRNNAVVARLPDTTVVLFPYECTDIDMPLAMPATSTTAILGKVYANGVEYPFNLSMSAPSNDETLCAAH